jgi:aspartate carbamoyltransferase regulatory subunit
MADLLDVLEEAKKEGEHLGSLTQMRLMQQLRLCARQILHHGTYSVDEVVDFTSKTVDTKDLIKCVDNVLNAKKIERVDTVKALD